MLRLCVQPRPRLAELAAANRRSFFTKLLLVAARGRAKLRGRPMKILVVEDDPLLRDGLVDLLKGAGHNVDVVDDGITAAKRGMDGTLDLIILDVMLPKLDGIEVCHRLRKAQPGLPIL